MQRTLLFFFFCFSISNIGFSQTNPIHDHDHEHQGCHFTKSKIKMTPLTNAEKVMLSESNERSDTIDILNYSINLDITNFSGQTINGHCEITLTPKVNGVDDIKLDLLNLPIDSIQINGSDLVYTYDGNFIEANFDQLLNVGDTVSMTIFYGGQPTTAAGGFGGLDFDGNIAYNLGIGLGENPYNFGRGWFPCFDNFVERATYDLNIITNNGRKAHCIGTFLGEEDLGNGTIIRRYRMAQQLPTYLVGVAVSDYTFVDYTHTGQYGDLPVRLIARPGDMGNMENSFEYLDDCIDALEAWYGQYTWERVGFVLTPRGAMEHCTSIAFPTSSGINGPTFGANRLIAHELAHHWWGNVTTLSSPANMWLKEGNAEYSAHLFTEYTFGKDDFLNQVKNNHLFVMRNAHIDDDGFQPLSGIPYEQTYGTHTYQKGASMIHNMRGYMGDSLFQMGQTAVLQDYAFQSIDAETYRDHLTNSTGVDMTSFFDDWIFAPGHADYEINAMTVTPNGNNYDVAIEIQQKGRATPHFHTNVPLKIAFYDENYTSQIESFMVSDEFSTVNFTLPFEPIAEVLNPNHNLNLAQAELSQTVYEADDMRRTHINMTGLEATSITDSAFVSIAHHWTAADDSNDPNVRMSDIHYWAIRGDFPTDFVMKATIQYSPANFESDLLEESDDSLKLMWRPNAESEWQIYSDYTVLDFGSSGFFRIEPMVAGDYAFANAADIVSTQEVTAENLFIAYPNPSSDIVTVEGKILESSELTLVLTDLTGKEVLRKKTADSSVYFKETIEVENLPTGIYNLQIINQLGDLLTTEKIKVM